MSVPTARGCKYPAEEARPLVESLARQYGSMRRAGEAFGERHGYAVGSGERMLVRLRNQPGRAVLEDTLDRLRVML